jgi:hypothetical protein
VPTPLSHHSQLLQETLFPVLLEPLQPKVSFSESFQIIEEKKKKKQNADIKPKKRYLTLNFQELGNQFLYFLIGQRHLHNESKNGAVCTRLTSFKLTQSLK